MRPLVCFVIALLASIAAAFAVGVNVGSLFALVFVMALLAPVAACAGWIDGAASIAGVLPAALLLLVQPAMDTPAAPILLLLIAYGLAIVALTRLLRTLRLPDAIAVGVVVPLQAAWLLWPIWMSPWITDDVAGVLVDPHPLLTLSAMLPQWGYWTHTPTMYRLSNLGQDIAYLPGENVWRCVGVHLAIAMAAVLAQLGVTWLIGRWTSAASPSPAA